MARTKTALVPAADDQVADGIELAQAQAAERSALVLKQFGEDLPYERMRLVTETRFFMAQSAEAMLEAGKRLIVMKEHEPHGEFTHIVEGQLGLNQRTARVMMQAAVKFLAPQLESKRQALAVLGKTKLLELVTESDEDLAGLADGGTLAGMTLDEIDSMTSRELKAKLREEKEESKTKDQLLAAKGAQVDKLQSDMEGLKRKLVKATPDDDLQQLRTEFMAEVNSIEIAIRHTLHDGASKLMVKGVNNDVAIAGLLLPIEDALMRLREEFNIPNTVAADDMPAWAKAE